MTHAIRIHQHGGPEAMVLEQVSLGRPAAGEVRIRHTAIGLNYIDVYYRSGVYAAPNGLPLVPGNEAAGVVEELGEGVTSLQVGDRVAYAAKGLGAYATERLVGADQVVKIPDGVSDEQAAAMMLQGMTVEYLLRRTYEVKPGTTVLYHAAAGGVGLIFGQWAKHLGATVIGTAGSAEKVELAKAHGFDHVINYSSENFVERVAEITGGAKCDVVYDSVGKDTFEGSLDCLRPRGLFVTFGQSSGAIPPFNTGILAQKGSLYVTRPTIFSYNAKREDLEESARALFDVVSKGIVKINVNQRYKLADAAQAHRDLEARKTTGTTVLLP
ncbi:quinone oxidoreductase family protein [Tianweitania sediminis]|uniref:Quinone oxidoreductase n=1 Tax=Tianweitania sediminis TaxID=1502156 RepID=A0A8J7R9R3_9HYPH|nr:quinone oxidoreductase [Tianweitania sediminis]MBP0440952.1 quinone oxidoreductase [Tianweitania sediminis]